MIVSSPGPETTEVRNQNNVQQDRTTVQEFSDYAALLRIIATSR
jgi:hypothetical protein